MKYFIYFLAIILLLGLNLGVFSSLKIWGIAPNLLLIFVMIFTFSDSSFDFVFIALLSGIFLDVYSPLYFGSFSISLLLLAYCLYFLVHNVLTFEIDWKFFSLILAGSLLFVFLCLWGYNKFIFRLGLSTTYTNFHFFTSRFLIEFLYSWALFFPMRKFVELVKLATTKFSVRQKIL